jgi:hypothetical protein
MPCLLATHEACNFISASLPTHHIFTSNCVSIHYLNYDIYTYCTLSFSLNSLLSIIIVFICYFTWICYNTYELWRGMISLYRKRKTVLCYRTFRLLKIIRWEKMTRFTSVHIVICMFIFISQCRRLAKLYKCVYVCVCVYIHILLSIPWGSMSLPCVSSDYDYNSSEV